MDRVSVLGHRLDLGSLTSGRSQAGGEIRRAWLGEAFVEDKNLSYEDVLAILSTDSVNAEANFGDEGLYKDGVRQFLLELKEENRRAYNQLEYAANNQRRVLESRRARDEVFRFFEAEGERVEEVGEQNVDSILESLDQLAILSASLGASLGRNIDSEIAEGVGFLVGGLIPLFKGLADFIMAFRGEKSTARRIWEGIKGGATSLMGGLYFAAGFGELLTESAKDVPGWVDKAATGADVLGLALVLADGVKQVIGLIADFKSGKLTGARVTMYVLFLLSDLLIGISNGLGVGGVVTGWPLVAGMLGTALTAYTIASVIQYKTRKREPDVIDEKSPLKINEV